MPTNLITHPKIQVTRYNRLILWLAIAAVVAIFMGYILVIRDHAPHMAVEKKKPVLTTLAATLVAEPVAPPSAPPDMTVTPPSPPPHEQPYLWKPDSSDKAPAPPPPPIPSTPGGQKQKNPIIELRLKERQDAYRAPLLVEEFSTEKSLTHATGETSTANPMQHPQTLEIESAQSQEPWGERPASEQGGIAQDAGQGFQHNADRGKDSQYLNARLQPARSPYQINAGMMLPVVLAQDVTSDVQSFFSAIVTQDLFDSVTSRFLLVPAGSRIVFMSDLDNQTNQQPILLMSAKTLYLPNGSSIALQGMPAANGFGMTGVSDQINRHFLQRYGSAAVLSLVVAGIRMATYSNSSGGGNGYSYSPQDAATNGMGMVMGQTVGEDLRRKLAIKPTVVIRAGYPFNVTVVQDMVFPGPYNQRAMAQD